jgi:hypothetical protein
MEQVTIFTDTNGFIQLRDFKDIPWRELFPNVKRVSIMVAKPVIEELDRHKVSTNARRRDRARAALKLINQASAAPNRTIELRQEPITVTLTVPRRIKPDWTNLTDLDQDVADDQLVAAALTHGKGAVLLSHDSGPLISARDVGLVAYEPPESWLLPAEQSDDQRRIGKLERELKHAQTRLPQLEIAFPQSDDQELIRLYRYRLPQLPQNIIDGLAYAYINANPRRELKVLSIPFGEPPGGGVGFSQNDATRYSAAYSKFRDEVHTYFQKLHERLALVAGVPELQFSVSNTGSGSASKLVVKIAVEGDFSLVVDGDRKDVAGTLALPEAPEARMESHDRLRALTSTLFTPALHPQLPSDPTEMKWIERPKMGEDSGSYGCEDFRPGETYPDRVFLWPGRLPSNGLIRITASAQHTPAVIAVGNVLIEDRSADWANPEVLNMLPEPIRSRIAAVPPANS